MAISSEVRLRDFAYHTVEQDTAHTMAAIRGHYYALAEKVLEIIPDCRERSIALTHLEESSMRAIQALAVFEGVRVPPVIHKIVREAPDMDEVGG